MKDNYCIAVLPGDGCGAEVMSASIDVLNVLNLPITLKYGDIGWQFWQQQGNPIPDKTWQLIDSCDSCLLGAITSKPEREAKLELSEELKGLGLKYLSPIIQLRQKLDLYANVRPCFSILPGSKPFKFCVIRENTEGLYSGFDYHPVPEAILELLQTKTQWQSAKADELSCSLRVQSQAGLQRLFAFAFDYAKKQGLTKVTFADKPNVLRASSAFARDFFEASSALYPEIEAEIMNADACALHLVRRPERFGVIVAENMFGDVLSDLGAGIMGGLGLAPSANFGTQASYFEPVHGSAPAIAPNKANPSAMFLSIALCIESLGFIKQAKLIRDAVCQIIKQGRVTTYDLSGEATTIDMAKAIIGKVEELSV